jgi:hypothetical protein
MKKRAPPEAMGFVEAVGRPRTVRRATARDPIPQARPSDVDAFPLTAQDLAIYDQITAANGFSMDAALENLRRGRGAKSPR